MLEPFFKRRRCGCRFKIFRTFSGESITWEPCFQHILDARGIMTSPGTTVEVIRG